MVGEGLGTDTDGVGGEQRVEGGGQVTIKWWVASVEQHLVVGWPVGSTM